MLALVILLKVPDDFLVWPKQTDRRKKARALKREREREWGSTLKITSVVPELSAG